MNNVSKNKKESSKEYGARRGQAACSVVKARLKKCVIIISAFAVCLLLVLANFISYNSVTAFADEVQYQNPIKACIFKFDGYHDKDAEGRLTGYGVEFLNLVSKHSGLDFQYVWHQEGWNWDEDSNKDDDKDDSILAMLESGEVDVVTSVSMNEERKKVCDFSSPIGRKRTVLSIQVDDIIRHRGEYGSYDGMTIGQLSGNAGSQNPILRDFAEGKFSYTTKNYDDDEELAEALQKGEVQAILSSDLRKTKNEKILDVLEENYFYAVVRKGEKALLDEINYAIEQMDINEGDWQNELFYKYYNPVYVSERLFNEREENYINKVIERVQSGGKKITVTSLGKRAPYSYVENGELKGILPDYFAEIMRLAAEKAGLEEIPYEFVVPADVEDYKRLINGEVDIVLDNIYSDVIEEGAIVSSFNTDSYVTARMARVSRQDYTGKIKTVAVADFQDQEIIKQLKKEYGEDNVKLCSDGEEAMRAVLGGKADAAYVHSYTAQWFINHGYSDSLYYSSVNGMSTTFSMRVSENTDHELVTILNKCIKQMSDDTLNQLASKYTSYTIGDVSFGEYLKANPGLIIAIVLIIALIIFVILVLYLRGRWNQKLLHTTEQSNKKMGEQLAIVEALSRDYMNVYAINEEPATARILKLEGYVAEGLRKDSAEEYNYAAILEKYISTRVHPDDREELSEALSLDTVREKLSAENEYQGSYRILDNGEIHHFQYTYLKIAGDHGDGGFILAGFRNIDEMIRKEQEQKNVLSEALEQAQYANKAKTTFLNSMSHDIRTPMNAIIGFTSLATTHIENKEQVQNYLGKIMTSGNHLLSLINDVLDMSRIESGKVKIEEKETSLPEIMHDLKTIVQADVKAKQLELRVELDVTNETIICDKLRLNQVLLNILSNAVKYTKSGGMVSVRVSQTAEAQEGYASYAFKVKDTGIGMSPEFLQHVFEPFEREQTSTVSGIQGTGLGLAITKNLVDLMGGTITVESEVGNGSEFTVTFCFRVAESPDASQQLAQGSANDTEKSKPHFDGKRLLLVEDNELNQEIAQSILEEVGFVIDTADDGSVAVEQMKKMPAGTYDLILMDVQMPIMNGYEATKAIRALNDSAKAATPIVAMTANAFEEDKKAAMDAGMNGFAAKPIDIGKLMKTLEELLK